MARKQKLTSTADAAKLTPIGADVEKELRGGHHLTPKAVALVLIGGDTEKQLELSRIAIVQQMLKGATEAEIKETTRAAKSGEKIMLADDATKLDNTVPQNYGPLVVALCDMGMGIGTAKTRASEFRAIASAFPHGELPKDVQGWHAAVEAARQAKKDQKTAEAMHELSLARRTLLGEGIEKYGTKEEAEKYAAKELAKRAKDAEAEIANKKLVAEVKKITDLGFRAAMVIVQAVAEKYEYKVVKLTKEEVEKANVNESPALPERGKAAKGEPAVH